MFVEFNGKFFFIALILSIIVGISSNILTWWHIFIRINPSDIVSINLFLSPIIFVCRVILPFILMYYQAKNIHAESRLMPILIGTFFGTWIGQVISGIGIHTFLLYLSGSHFTGYNILHFVFTISWQIVILALSSTLFILTTAILLAHYQKQQETKQLQPPALHSSQ